MTEAGAGNIGAYVGCSFRSPGIGAFVPREGADPFVGTVGRASLVEETRVEMVAPRHREGAVVAALVSSHPYEEPAFDVYDVRSNQALIGRVGRLVAPAPLGDFASLVQERLSGPPVRMAGDREGPVQRVAVLPGSGADFIEAATMAGAEVLVTGDVSHHRAATGRDRGLAILDAGHAATERPGLQALYAAIAALVDTADVTAADTDPWES
jgi:hypothetical protein